MQAELKNIDITGNCVVNTVGAIVLLNPLAQGYDNGYRVARFVKLTAYELRAYVTSASEASAQTARLIIVYDRQTNGAAPVMLDILSVASPISTYNSFNLDRFEVLYDNLYAVREHGTDFKQPNFDEDGELSHTCNYNSSSTATVADYVNGAVFLLSIGNVAAGETAATMYYRTRIYYYDE